METKSPLGTLFDLTGRVALVTGGSKGLGKAMATIFARAGAGVVISARHEDELAAAAAEIGDAGGRRVECVVADMTRRDDVRRLADAAVAALGKVDILVNNAGSNLPQAIDQIRDEDWDRLVELNLSSCMALTRALAPGMKERRWGRIIHISSIMGLASTAERNVYSATKSGADRDGAGERLGPGALQRHGQLSRPRPLRHRHADVDPQCRSAGGLGRPHGARALGASRGVGRSRPAFGQRGGQLHYRRRPGGRRRRPGPRVLKYAATFISRRRGDAEEGSHCRPAPIGATVNSQGCKPLGKGSNDCPKAPKGATLVGESAMLSPRWGSRVRWPIVSQGLTTLAIDCRRLRGSRPTPFSFGRRAGDEGLSPLARSWERGRG